MEDIYLTKGQEKQPKVSLKEKLHILLRELSLAFADLLGD